MVTRSVLVLGARSDIGRAIAQCFAQAGYAVILAARASSDLGADLSDLKIRHNVEASAFDFDVTDGEAKRFFDGIGEMPSVVVMVVGLLGDQKQNETDLNGALDVMSANYTGPACYLLEAARRMEVRGSGFIVGISSVAGDRGRQSNYIYGSAKAGFTAFLSGLRNRLFKRGVSVVTVKPGFVATKMTENMRLPPLLTASPNEVADKILSAVNSGRDVIYVRSIWYLIMTIIRSVPESIFKRLSL
jgi:decaprenylphospho-beta-D-erythro-pentofuranosid-2-ulose 2-reductase